MSLLRFIKDKKYDAEMIFEILKGRDEQGILEYAQSMGVSAEDAKKIAGGDKAFAEKIADERYGKVGNELDKVIIEYQGGWDESDKKFFERLVELTKFPLAHKNYECVIVTGTQNGRPVKGKERLILRYGDIWPSPANTRGQPQRDDRFGTVSLVQPPR